MADTFDPDAYLAGGTSSTFDPNAYLGVQAQKPAESAGFLAGLGRGAASLADVTVGGIVPAIMQQVGYPIARLVKSPEEASRIAGQAAAAFDSPIGKALGITQTPEYQGEAGRKLLQFVAGNIEKGVNWLSDKTGMSKPDVENMLGSLSLAAPQAAAATVRAAKPVVQSVAEQAKTGARLAFDERLTAKENARSAADYARGPQIDAAAEAQRLGLAIPPEAIQPTAGPKILSAVAGETGVKKMADANQAKVREIALNDMGLPPDTQLNGKAAFNKARGLASGPYKEVRQLPTMVADDAVLSSLESVRPDATLIATEASSKAINAMVDRAIEKVSKGLNGDEMLRDIQQLRENARKIYGNKNADLSSLDRAEASLGIANALESMIEGNIFNPKLLERFREARKQNAKIYAYEGATDFNTGLLDATKLAKMTGKDNALTGDIAALGQVAGNFPEVFSPASTTGKGFGSENLRRSGLAGSLGGAAGYLMGGDYLGGVIGGVLGAGAGSLAQLGAARKVASPAYQAGLNLQDFRIPAAQQAAAVPPSQALVTTPPEVFGPGEGSAANLKIVGFDNNGRPIYAPESTGPGFTMPPQPSFGAAPTPFAQRGLPNEVPRQTYEAQKRAELAQEFRARDERKPTSGEVLLEIDPLTGQLRQASQGIRGATPETFSNFGSSLESAANKVTQGRAFDLTAEERVAWNKTKVDLAEVAPGFKSLSDKAIAEKMMDREWVEKTAKKAREKAAAFDEIARKAGNMKALQEAMINREKMLDIAAQMEESLGAPRPSSRGYQQGSKTRAFQRGLLTPDEF